MAKKVSIEDLQQYTSWRDDFLHIVKDKICKPCTDPQKLATITECVDPITCECRCERVENLISNAEKIDTDLKELIKSIK